MKLLKLALSFMSVALLAACANETSNEISLSAASSTSDAIKEICSMYKKSHSDTTFLLNFDSSGKIQNQIENGADCDIFLSAATKNVDNVSDFVDERVDLLTNKMVIIAPKDSEISFTDAKDLLKADIVAIGNPESVPAGQYAKESLENLGIYDELLDNFTLGSNVSEVLSWVESGSVPFGIVYETDAKLSSKVEIIYTFDSSLHKKIVYPLALLTENKDAEDFYEFLQKEEISVIWEAYGFSSCSEE